MSENKKIILKIKQEHIYINNPKKEKTLTKINEESAKEEIAKNIKIKGKNQTDIVAREEKRREETSFCGEARRHLTGTYDINGLREEKILIKELKFKRRYKIDFDTIGKINLRKIRFIPHFVIALYLIFSSQIIQSNYRIIESTFSSINLKVNGTGDIKIFGDSYVNKPDIVIINNENKSEITNTYHLENDFNNITLIWDKAPNKSTSMFDSCNRLNEIDLSNFDTSEITDMSSMFFTCTSLYFIDFSDVNTSKVKDMNNMFYGCSSLKSLNLSSFDTSQVLYMNAMFSGCSSLKSLNLSNFVTSRVTNMNLMFYNCLELEYVNLKSAVLAGTQTMIFDSTPSDLMVCSENSGWKNLNTNFKKTINFNCINKVSNDNTDTYNINCFTKNIIIDNNYSCPVCGNNYLMKYNSDDISKINCYEYKKGYYFDNSDLEYKLCYISCKNCDTAGDKFEHNCTECKEEYNHELEKSSFKNCYTDIYNSRYIISDTSIYQTYDLILTEKISQKDSITNLISNKEKISQKESITNLISNTEKICQKESIKSITSLISKTEKISQKESITNLISNMDYYSFTTYQILTSLITQKNIGIENRTELFKI